MEMQARSPLENLPSTQMPHSSSQEHNAMLFAHCYICQRVTSEPLVKNPTNHRKVLSFISERAAFGDTVYSNIKTKMNGITIKALMSCSATFHGSCYRKTIHAGNFKRIKEQYYKKHPRKRPFKASASKATQQTAPLQNCLLCENRLKKRTDQLQTSYISYSGVKYLQTALMKGYRNVVIEKLPLHTVEPGSALWVTYHLMCWKKCVTDHVGNIEMTPVGGEDLVEEKFISYLKEKLMLTKFISVAVLHRMYLSLIKKHKIKHPKNRKAFKQFIRAKLNDVNIRKRKKKGCELVSLNSKVHSNIDLQQHQSTSHLTASYFTGIESEHHEQQQEPYELCSRVHTRSQSRSDGMHSPLLFQNVYRSGLPLSANVFPDEILLKIFGYLTTEELGQSVLPVCRRWHAVGRDPKLWLDLVLKRNDQDRRRSCLAVIRGAPLLRSLNIKVNRPYYADVSDIIETVATSCPNLGAFIAPFRPAVPSALLESLVEGCPKIFHFDFQHFISKEIVVDPDFLLPLTQLKNLQRLYLGHTRYFPADLLVREISEHCRKLQRLDIAGMIIQDDTFRYLATKLCCRLRRLGFTPSMNTKSFISIIQFWNLDKLHLKFGYHASHSENQLPSIRTLSNLKKLSIQFKNLGHNAELCRLFREPGFAPLEVLELRGYHDNAGDDVLQLVSLTMPALRTLTLRSLTCVTDVGIARILQGLKHLTSLLLIEMDAVTGSSLLKHAKGPHSLQNLAIVRCPMFTSFLINELKLKKSFKNVNIKWEAC